MYFIEFKNKNIFSKQFVRIKKNTYYWTNEIWFKKENFFMAVFRWI